METLVRDLRLGCRLLLRQPGFSLVAVLTLALGIGGSTAIFSVVDAALLRPLPYPNPDRLVDIDIEVRRSNGHLSRMGPGMEDVRDWQEDGRIFSHVAVWRNAIRPAVLDGPQPERVRVLHISDGYLSLHGVQPFLGRGFGPEDMHRGAPPVVILGYDFWRSRFGGDRAIVGTTVRLDNQPATIVGVLPQGFYAKSKVWRPLQPPDSVFTQRGSGASTYGRMRPGIDIEEAQRTLAELTARLDREQGREAGTVRLESLYESTTAGYFTTTKILTAAVGFILLIACINVAGLLLARGAARRPELAIRASIGAGRARLFRQLLTESVVLSVAGGAVGLLLAWISLDVLVANIPLSLPSNSPVTLNLRVLAFAAGLSLATGTCFGLVPAIRLSGVRVTDALSHAGRRQGSALSRRGGQALIAIEVALALVLLAGAGLMIRSFSHLTAIDVGFDPESFLTMEVVPVNPDDATLKQYYPALVESLRNVPGVEAAGASDHVPLAGGSTMTRAIVEGQRMSVNIRRFVPGYFEAVGFRLKQGRFPAASDRGAPAPSMLNEKAAAEMFPRGSAIGRRFEVAKAEYVVLGIVGNVRHSGPLWPAEPEVYLAFGIGEARPMMITVRSREGAPALGSAVRQAARGVGPRVVVDRIRRGSDWFDDRVVTPRRRTVLLGLLGGLGLLLSLVGIFGMTAYAVARRTQEIGVRMAFGARPAQVVRTMVRDSLWPVGIGIVSGLGGAALATRVIATFLFDTRPTEPATFAAVALLLGVAACLAAWIPARRASRVDPVAALRAE
ncbi:MAG: hypothetical protein A3H96_08185 [Acidobacteria bacterium RIFCSPLOWO2_02_FULL_67_36]|nr:MAG: hypothetical protein A3H96_08185 [Acidobacteria bacterium RIFCSPLOWO2_02_FULL_67_36]OFW24690.1 MAG: hypothetical protein A3G21_17250 [Acidobacteria bacterium RIFCSPLOWO2_12_FULL_66_21]